MTVNASPELEPRAPQTRDQRLDADDENNQRLCCTVAIGLSSCATLDDLQVCVDVSKPFVPACTFYAVPTLCERTPWSRPRSKSAAFTARSSSF